MTNGTEHLSAGGFDGFRRLSFQIMPKGIVGGDEEPSLAALGNNRFAQSAAVRIGIISPVDRVGCAFFTGEQGGAGARTDDHLVLLLGQISDRECYRRISQVENRTDVLIFVPAPGNLNTDVGLVR